MKKISLCLGLLLLPFVGEAADETPSETLVVEGKVTKPVRPELRPKVPDYSLQTQRFDFPTGLRIYMQADPTHPIASVFTVVDHGHADDAEGAEGSAHFCEHLWFRSSHDTFGEEFNGVDVMSILNDIGAQMNATTRADWTDYRTVASKEFLPLMLKMESARLVKAYRNVTADEIPTEREVIRNEWRRRNEQSTALLWDYLGEAVYPEGHPYNGRSTHESLDNITLEVLQKYFDDYYHPDRTTITVIGDFDPREASSLIFENFDPSLLHPEMTKDDIFFCPKPGVQKPKRDNPDDWWTCATEPGSKGKQAFQYAGAPEPRITKDRQPVPEVGKKEPIRKKMALGDKVKHTVAIGWPLPGGYRADQYDLNIAANMVSNAMLTGFANQDDVRKRVKFGGCGAQPFKHHSLGLCVADITSSSLDPEWVAEKMLNQLSLIVSTQQTGTDAAQFERASLEQSKQSSLASTLMGIDNVASVFGGRGETIGVTAHYTGRGSAYSDEMVNIMGIDLANAKRAALEYFTRKNATILILDPLKDDEIDVSGEKSSYVGSSTGDTMLSGGEYYKNMSVEEISSAYISPKMNKLVDTKLPNGMRIIFMPHSAAPIVQANLMISGGPQLEKTHGLHDYAMYFSDWKEPFPSNAHDVLRIAGQETYGSYGTDFGIGYRVPAGNLDGALWFLREYVDRLGPNTAGKYNYMRSRRGGVKGSWNRIDWHSSDMLGQYLYGDHPVGHKSTLADVEVWGALKYDDIRAYLDERLHPENTTLIVVGNLNVEQAKDLAIQYFASWEGRGEHVNEGIDDLTAPPMPKGKKVYIFDSPKKTQTQTTQACRLNYENDSDRHAISVLSELVATRTFTQLRVKEGLAYSPGGYAVNYDKYGIMAFSSLAVNQGVGRTVEFFDEAIREMENGEIDEGLLNQAKLRKNRGATITGQSTSQMMGLLTSVVANERPWTAVTDLGNHYAAVTVDQMKRLTKGCADNSIVTLVGPKEMIEPQLKEKGIEYEVVDWKQRGDDLLAKYDPKAAKKKAKAKAKSDAKKKKQEEKKKKKEAKNGTSSDSESKEGEASESGETDAGGEEKAAE